MAGTDSLVRCQIAWIAWGQNQPGPRARDLLAFIYFIYLMAIILRLAVQQWLSPARKLSWELWWMEEVGPAVAQPGGRTATALVVHVKQLL